MGIAAPLVLSRSVASAEELATATTLVRRELGPITRLGVAFSGGIDSTVLLALTSRILGHDNVLALLAVSPSLAAEERVAAHRIAAGLGVRVVEVATHELDSVDYRANRADRCFFCKDELFSRIDDTVLVQHQLDAIAYGENADDVKRVDRPGARAATEHGVLRPLARSGLVKTDVRALARRLALPNADKPASPCLASRIPHSEPVTAEKLVQIDRAETALRHLGFSELRVRHHGHSARIELSSNELPRALVAPEDLIEAVKGCGFADVVIDTGGLRSGAFTLAALGRQ